ncbi:prolyl oligopeptidase family serine peptidase [Pseudoroseicyclus aestuarii]|uniref:prolyl oligopeptidase family serine peptidase n=1 Tax=Pseudoroseicyclus aestuarii TaxID=1795041 RepID=UPI0015E8DE3B|nr:prolyl oligopeptidase family serine peptidase [Pseudoroseicyclus aestuarii]
MVDWYGVTDLASVSDRPDPGLPGDPQDATSPEAALIGGAPADRPKAVRLASPLTHVGAGAAPVLIQHGTADRIVPFKQAEELLAAYQAAGVPAEMDRIEGADHCFWGVETAPILPRAIAFLKARLGA